MFLAQTPEQRIASNVIGSLLPTIRDILPLIDSQESSWAANKILEMLQAKLLEAGSDFNETTFGNYSLADWLEWSTVFYAFKAFADSDIEVQYPDGSSKTVKPREVVNKFYTPKVVV